MDDDAAPVRDFDRWAILSFRLRAGGLWVEYRDETGTHRSMSTEDPVGDEFHWHPVPLLPASVPVHGLAPGDVQAMFELTTRFRDVHIPDDLAALLRAGFEDFGEESRSHWMPEPVSRSELVPWLLPVFVSPPPGMEARPWEPLVQALLASQLPASDRFVVMRLARRVWKAAPPIALPLTILEASEPGADWLAGIRERHWYMDNREVREYGVRLEREGSTPWFLRRRRATRPHIVLERTSRARRPPLLEWARRRAALPRLLVSFNDGPLDEGLSAALSTLPKGSSLLLQQAHPQLPDVEAQATLMELVYALVHDFALHEALWIVSRARPGHFFLLASDPAANQGLRLSRVMRQMVDDTLDLALPSAGGDAFSINEESDPSSSIQEALRAVGALAFDFSRESRGLAEMAHVLAGPIRRIRELGLTGAPGAFPLELRRERRETPARRADVALEEWDAFGVLSPMDERSRRQPLRRGWPYRIRVHIGQPDPSFSAIDGEVPPIDPLLPDVAPDATLAIDVAVFEKSFVLRSPGLQTLRLPPYGGTRPVYFEVRTPLQPGPADLRIALYHGNNLLQSFVLEAWIGERDASSTTAAAVLVSVRLASSGTARFGNLRQLGERALSIALNDDVRGGTHTLMIKRGTLRESIALTEKQVEQHMREFRDLLQKAMNATGSHSERLFAVEGQASSEREQQFAAYLRQFARIGHNIWNMLVERRGVDTAALLALKQGGGETLQFVRHGRLLPFPWQTVYDYPLPQGPDFQKARVCLADGPVVRQPGPRETGCPHHPGEAVVCIEGFWSVRHLVEQLTEDRERSASGTTPAGAGEEDRVTLIDVPSGSPLVCLGIGNDDLPARSLRKQLEAHLGTSDLRVLKEDDEPLEELLWKVPCRPGLLIVLSHLRPADPANNLPARIEAVASKPAFSPNVITSPGLLQQKLHFKEWTAPRSFVLLMACESAQVQLEQLTNLIDTFFGVGAGAVAGTETDVMSDLAADFARQIAIGLTASTAPQSLGALVRAYTAAMFKSHNPLPFAFPVFGSADLTVRRLPS